MPCHAMSCRGSLEASSESILVKVRESERARLWKIGTRLGNDEFSSEESLRRGLQHEVGCMGWG